jgi:gliding motility-associated lipoprotein GldH
MRIFLLLIITAIFFTGCDDDRVFEQITDLESREWLVADKPAFEFVINNSGAQYNLYCNIRNSVSYPYSRFFFTYYLEDSTGAEIKKELVTKFLFDEKTGKPFGKSGIGDLYDHRIVLLKNHQFPYKGKFRVKFEQFMRMDTLPGIIAVGLRVERARLGK